MINVQNLSKRYDDQFALEGVNLHIAPGEFYGLLGPNGAGKSTTINILSGIVRPDTGQVTIDGVDLATRTRDYKMGIGVVPQEIALYNDLSAVDNLMFWGSLYKLSKNALRSRIDELLTLVGLADRGQDKVKHYSGGMKRRINIAAALLHQPRVLFLDEPTVGIDPQSRNLIFDLLRQLHCGGMTIVYTTHYMEEAEKLCQRIGIIDNGHIIIEGSLTDLKKQHSQRDLITIHTKALVDNEPNIVREVFGTDVLIEDSTVAIPFLNTPVGLQELIRQWNRLRLPLYRLSITETNLETIFLDLTGKHLRD